MTRGTLHPVVRAARPHELHERAGEPPALRGWGMAVLTVVLALGLQSNVDAQGGQWGNVKGKILWGSNVIPKQKPIDAVATNADKAACLKDGNIVVSEQWVVNPKNKGLRWTFVWLAHDDPMNKAPLPIHPDLASPKSNKVAIDQPLCAFVPHALGMREGQILEAKNAASIAHNFKWTGNPSSPNAGNNVLIAPGGSIDIKGLVADRLPVKIECNIHPWMNGWVRVFNHPYFAVTDADGAFEFKDAPAGAYRLIVWHGSGGWLGGAKGRSGEQIQIKAGATVDLGSRDYPPPPD